MMWLTGLVLQTCDVSNEGPLPAEHDTSDLYKSKASHHTSQSIDIDDRKLQTVMQLWRVNTLVVMEGSISTRPVGTAVTSQL